MGEIAEMILEGLLCQVCGQYVDGEVFGHPRNCDDCCSEESQPIRARRKPKVSAE